jgi:hypothetical protein
MAHEYFSHVMHLDAFFGGSFAEEPIYFFPAISRVRGNKSGRNIAGKAHNLRECNE